MFNYNFSELQNLSVILILQKIYNNKTMNKTIKFVLIALIAIMNQSCSSDDSTIENINETFINGKWILVKTTENGLDVALNVCDKMNTIEFIDSSNEVIQKTHVLNSANICEIDTNSTDTYVINGNNLETTSTSAFVIELGNTNGVLVLKHTQNETAIVNTYNRL